MNGNVSDDNEIKENIEEKINKQDENIAKNKLRKFIYLNVIPGLVLTLFLVVGIILLITGYSMGNINYEIKTNCTIKYPLMNRYSNYYAIVAYINTETNKTNIAESLPYSLEEYYTKYNYRTNDTLICFTSVNSINTISFYQQSIYSSDKQALIIVGYIFIASCLLTFGIMLVLSILTNFKNQQNVNPL